MNPIQQKEVIPQGEQLDKACAICFDAEAERIAVICNHIFHRACIDQWLRTIGSNGQCPLCRHQLAPRVAGQLFDADAIEPAEAEEPDEEEEAEIEEGPVLNRRPRFIVGYAGWDEE